MRKFKLTLLTFVLSLLTFTKTKAQDDPNVGFYVDGVKVSEINCYSFGILTVVFPFNSAYNNYDRFIIRADYGESWSGNYSGCFNILSKASLLAKVKGNYIIYEIFTKDSPNCAPSKTDFNDGNAYSGLDGKLCRSCIAHYWGKKQGPETDLRISIAGETISGYADLWNDDCQCNAKTPTYSFESLGNILKLHLLNRQKASGGVLNDNSCEMKIDMAQPCNVSGTKVDFNNLSGQSNNTLVKTDSGPYSEKWENGKIKVQGQKNADGEQEGTWKYFNEDGKLERIENYLKGISNGEWKYYEEGKLVKTETYKEGELISSKEVK